MLLGVVVPANASIFLSALFQVAGFDALPTDDMYDFLFDIDEEPISANFDTLGYSTRQFLYNVGSLGLLILFFLPFLAMVYIFKYMPCETLTKFSAKQRNKIFFNDLFSFLLESYMMLAVCVCVNLTNMTWMHEISQRAFGVNVNIIITVVFIIVLVSLPVVVAIGYTVYF